MGFLRFEEFEQTACGFSGRLIGEGVEDAWGVGGEFVSAGVLRVSIVPHSLSTQLRAQLRPHKIYEPDGVLQSAFVGSRAARDDGLVGVPLMSDARVPSVEPFGDAGVASGSWAVTAMSDGICMLQKCGEHWTKAARDRAGGAYQWLPDAQLFRHFQARPEGTTYFGLGDKTGSLNRGRRRWRGFQTDALGYDAERSDPLYKHAPFFIVRNADGTYFGVLYETLDAIDIDLGCEHSNYFEPFRFVESPGWALCYSVIAGPTLRDVVRRFTALTGRQALPPRWAFGFAFSAMGQTDAEDAPKRIQAFVDRCRADDLPLSAVHFGSGYSMGDDGRRYVFEWNRRRFPDPSRFLVGLKQDGLRLCANVKPVLLTSHPRFEEAKEQGLFVARADGSPALERFWDGEGAQLDFTNPDTVSWWQGRLTSDILSVGFDGVWNDNNEAELWDEGARVHGAHAPAMAVRPAHALLMTKASRAAALDLRPDERPHMISRAGPIGLARYGETWTGDNETSWHTLKWNLRQGLSMGLTGMAMVGHDIGGFSGPVPTPELLVRWFQMMALHPRAVMNSWKPRLENGTTTPMLYPEVTPLVREALNLRLRFLPLLYTLSRHAQRTGDPIIRPSLYDFDDGEAVSIAEQDLFLLGPDVLVAPVVEEKAQTVSLTLPGQGFSWIDAHSGAHHAAGSPAVIDAPLARLPILVREGAVLPLATAWPKAASHDVTAIELAAFVSKGAGAADVALFWDDGLSHVDDAAGPYDHSVRVEWTDTTITVQLPRIPGVTLSVRDVFGGRRAVFSDT